MRPTQTRSGQARQRSAAQARRRRRPSAAVRRRRAFALTALIVIFVGLIAVAASLGGSTSTTNNAKGGSSSSSNSSTSTTHTTTPPPVVVSNLNQVSFVDRCPSCSTENFVTGTSTNGRTIGADIWYPSYGGTSPATGSGASPLIVLAPGYDLSPLDYQPLINDWVRAGFVVAAAVFPDTNPSAVAAVEKVYPVPGTHSPEADVANQPRDLGFLISQLATADRHAKSGNLGFLHKLFNANEIGVAGQSDGGDTVAGLYFNSCCAADVSNPVGAVAILSGAEDSGWFTGSWFRSDHTPLLVAQGTNDACNSPPNAVTLYNGAPASLPKYFLELRGANHLVAYTASGSSLDVVGRATTAFFDVYLHQGNATTTSLIDAGGSRHSSLTAAPSAPALSAVPVNWSYNPGTSLDPCSIKFTGPPHG